MWWRRPAGSSGPHFVGGGYSGHPTEAELASDRLGHPQQRITCSHGSPARPCPARARAAVRPGESEFRSDLERIRFARSFSRLAEVTQVITAGATSGVVHNRLTHTIKVTAVARAIAVRLLRDRGPGAARIPRRSRPCRGAGRSQCARSRSPALRAPRRAGAGPVGPRAIRAERRLRGQRPDLPDPDRDRGARAGRRGSQPDRGRARGGAEVPLGPYPLPRPSPDHWPTPPRGAGHGRDGAVRRSSPAT